MDHVNKRKRKINPQEKSNWLSRYTFFYTNSIFRRAYRHNLEEDDLYEVLKRHRSQTLGDELEREWLKEDKENQNSSIYRVLWTCYGKTYLIIGLVQLLMRSIMVILNPLAVSNLIYYLKEEQTSATKSYSLYYALFVILINLVNCIYIHNYMLTITEFGLKVRTAFCSLIYRKCLRLSSSSLSEITTGKIVTLITKDASAFEKIIFYGNDVWIGFVQAAIVCYLIYIQIGVSSFTGVGFFLLILPIQVYIGVKAMKYRTDTAKQTDARLHITQEAIGAIKIIKMYTWEHFYLRKISDARKKEISKIVKIFFLKAIILLMGGLTSKLAFYFLIMTYVWLGNSVNAVLMYYILTCFARLRHALSVLIPLGITEFAELNASVRRIANLLKSEEIQYRIQDKISIVPKILFKNASVTINKSTILKNISLKLDQGLIILTGNVGSGKSIFLKTILKDFPLINGHIDVEGEISYASQTPWVFPSSVKQNILFGEEYNEKRYNKILEICALQYDIQTFENGDETIVGDKGINLSKGQQARINLARAVYKDCDIYLLDDCLSSLDADVKEFVFKNCIKEFLKNKLCILVTAESAILKAGDKVIILFDGEVKFYLKTSDLNDKEIIKHIKKENSIPIIISNKDEVQEADINEKSKLLSHNNSKNIYHEKKRSGKVEKSTYTSYIRLGGGYLMLFIVFAFFILSQTSKSYTEKLVSNWVDLEQNISDYKNGNLSLTLKEHAELEQAYSTILMKFSGVIITTTLFSIGSVYLLLNFSRKASNMLHTLMLKNILEAVMSFFDRTFIGNILNRCSKDLDTIDENLPFILNEFIELFLALASIIILIATVNLLFLIPSLIFFVLLYFIRGFYLPTGRNLQRLDAATRSPVVGYLNSSMEGLTTIQACKAQHLLIKEFDKHQDLYTSANYTLKCTARAFGFILDMLCNVFISVIVVKFLIADNDTSIGDVGLAITQSFALTGLVQYGIRQWAEIENNMTSVERVLEYTIVETEKKKGATLEYWPTEGKIEFKNVSLRYPTMSEPVLDNISFVIQPKNKVGIVGRTGAGKTSITSVLMRLYDFEGKVLIDDFDTKMLSLDFLRKNVSIIPQDPVLFTGTIRSNIDPLNEYSDEDIWRVLEKIKMKNDFDSLDIKIGDYSTGEKQLICLARSLVKQSKIIILDEATANMDNATDKIIADIIKDHFIDCTVITIAHKLQSILNSDEVIVIDKGHIVEYDNPKVLMAKKHGVFSQMVQKAGLT